MLKPANSHQVQGSEAWLNWRTKGLGSSDAAVLLGLSPWKTFEELLMEKRGEWKPIFGEFQQAAMDRGKRLEPEVRKMAETLLGFPLPDESIEDKEHPFMRVSFDGVNWDKQHLIEIKCPNRKDHFGAVCGTLPEKYMPQVQWQMMVGGIPNATYVSWSGPEDAIDELRYTVQSSVKGALIAHYIEEGYLALVPVLPDPEMQHELRKRALFAWDLIKNPRPYSFLP